MRGKWTGVVALWGLLLLTAQLPGQDDRRRALNTPGLVLATDSPVAVTNALTFTSDGKLLLAAGRDKVARLWPFDGARLMEAGVATLRWATWHEQRGMINAVALSPDADNKLVAVGGYGLVTGAIVVFDRETRAIVHALTAPNSGDVVTALAFSRSGDELLYGTTNGRVGLWRFKSGKENDSTIFGAHAGKGENRIALVAFTAENRALSAAEDGTVWEWKTAGAPAPRELFRTGLRPLLNAVISSDGAWLAAVGQAPGAGKGRLELVSTSGKRIAEHVFEDRVYPKSIAISQDDKQLAIATEVLPAARLPHQPLSSAVYLYDVEKRKSRATRIKSNYLVHAVAFHPLGQHLAVAGGNDHEIHVWDLESEASTSELISAGNCLWQIGISEDGHTLGFQYQRKGNPTGFNDWGSGAWRVFDLAARGWAAEPKKFKPVEQSYSAGGWTVQADGADPFVWRVRGPAGQTFAVPLDRARDRQPKCFVFLPAADGKPVRLAVGHRAGISIFALRNESIERTRLYVGHADDVTSLAVSKDRKTLYSCSRDQTVAAWSLADWKAQAELGASFAEEARKVVVKEVAAGSPAWEAGLTSGDELRLLAYNGSEVAGGARPWLDRLKRPVPGHELFFRVLRRGQAEPIEMLTTVRQRPLWKLFATRDGEWVMWRWRDYFYDTSTRGDSYIGWQINGGVGVTPEFFEAEKFRNQFHKPEKIADLIAMAISDPLKVAIPELLPPKVELTALPGKPDEDLTVSLAVLSREGTLLDEPREVSLWINDYKFQKWVRNVNEFKTTVTIPRAKLRAGQNRLVAQAYSQSGTRGDSAAIAAELPPAARPPATPRMFGLVIGVSTYAKASPDRAGRTLWSNLLFAAEDARAMSEVLKKQGEKGAFERPEVRELVEQAATPAAVLEELRRISEEAKPDDVFVLFLAGHGYAKRTRQNAFEPHSFAFVGPAFDLTNLEGTGISGIDLYEAIAGLPCRKLLLLDCCHSGSSTNVLRELSPDGIGPVMMAACDAHESSYDITFLGHGAFTNSLLEALDAKFVDADLNRDDKVDASELFSYASRRVPRTIELARAILGPDATQTPMIFNQADATSLRLYDVRPAGVSSRQKTPPPEPTSKFPE